MTETEQTVALAIKAAKERDIHHIVVASTHGDTLELLKDCGLHVVGVTTAYDKGVCGLSEEKRKAFEAMGMDIVTAGHALSGAERSFSRKYVAMVPLKLLPIPCVCLAKVQKFVWK